MPITSWTPEVITVPLEAAFPVALQETGKIAQALAPGPHTKAGTRAIQTSATTGKLDASSVPNIGVILKGSKPGERQTAGYFVFKGRVVQAINHPGTPAHHYLEEASASFREVYVNTARGMLGRF